MGAEELAGGESGVLDTSVLIAVEQGRPLGPIPPVGTISVVTIAELYLGVLMADNAAVRAERLRTLSSVGSQFEPLPIDITVARTFAEMIAEARRQGKQPKIQD